MGLRVHRRLRRFAAFLALAGTLVYTGLVPWHSSSQLAALLLHAEIGEALSIICRDNAIAAADGETDPFQPAAPDSHCPICKGYVSFHLGVVPPALAAVIRPPETRATFRPHDEAVSDGMRVAPRSRGPPLPA